MDHKLKNMQHMQIIEKVTKLYFNFKTNMIEHKLTCFLNKPNFAEQTKQLGGPDMITIARC